MPKCTDGLQSGSWQCLTLNRKSLVRWGFSWNLALENRRGLGCGRSNRPFTTNTALGNPLLALFLAYRAALAALAVLLGRAVC